MLLYRQKQQVNVAEREEFLAKEFGLRRGDDLNDVIYILASHITVLHRKINILCALIFLSFVGTAIAIAH